MTIVRDAGGRVRDNGIGSRDASAPEGAGTPPRATATDVGGAAVRKRIPVADRLWRRTEVSEAGCWIWTGATNPHGYGQIGDENRRARLAHRVAYELTYGPIPVGAMVLHSCDVRACVRPEHLRVGSAADNTADMMGRSRNVAPRSLANGRAKLSDADVSEIRAEHRAGKSCKQIARERDLDSSYVGRIVREVRR